MTVTVATDGADGDGLVLRFLAVVDVLGELVAVTVTVVVDGGTVIVVVAAVLDGGVMVPVLPVVCAGTDEVVVLAVPTREGAGGTGLATRAGGVAGPARDAPGGAGAARAPGAAVGRAPAGRFAEGTSGSGSTVEGSGGPLVAGAARAARSTDVGSRRVVVSATTPRVVVHTITAAQEADSTASSVRSVDRRAR